MTDGLTGCVLIARTVTAPRLFMQEWVAVEWLRESELKHSRVAMLAVTGYIATDCGFKIPGEIHDVSALAPSAGSHRSRRAPPLGALLSLCVSSAHARPAHHLSAQVSSLNAHNVFVANGAFAQIFFWLFLIEALSYFAIVEMLEGSGRKPGDFGACATLKHHARIGEWGRGRTLPRRCERKRVTRVRSPLSSRRL